MDTLNAIDNKPENQFDFTKHSFAAVQKRFKEVFLNRLFHIIVCDSFFHEHKKIIEWL